MIKEELELSLDWSVVFADQDDLKGGCYFDQYGEGNESPCTTPVEVMVFGAKSKADTVGKLLGGVEKWLDEAGENIYLQHPSFELGDIEYYNPQILVRSGWKV
jgi:hypothetical protein